MMVSFLGEIHPVNFQNKREISRKPEGEVVNLNGEGKESDYLIEKWMRN